MQAIQSVKADASAATTAAQGSVAAPKASSGGLFALLLALLDSQQTTGVTPTAEAPPEGQQGETGDQAGQDTLALLASLFNVPLTNAPANPEVDVGDPAQPAAATAADAPEATVIDALKPATMQATVETTEPAATPPPQNATPVPAEQTVEPEVAPTVVKASAPVVKAEPAVESSAPNADDPVEPAVDDGPDKPAVAVATKNGKLLELAEPWKPAAEYLQAMETTASKAQATVEPVAARQTSAELTAVAAPNAARIAPAPSGIEKAVAPPPASDFQSTLEALPDTAVRSVRHLVNQGEQSLRVRLVPESLGEVNVEVTAGRDALVVKMTSQHAGVREVLQGQAHVLKEALAQNGIDVSRITVMTEAAPQQGHNPNGNRPSLPHAYGGDTGGSGSYRGGQPQQHRQPSGGSNPRSAWYGGAFNMVV